MLERVNRDEWRLEGSPGAARPSVTVRFAGDSGDGIQVLGQEFARGAAQGAAGFMTFPDYPAEIRAPAGTTFGVSAFQIRFGARPAPTPGDAADILVAFNPAALATNLRHLRRGGLAILDGNAFDARGLKKAGLAASPLNDGTLDAFQVLDLPIAARTLAAVAPLDVGRKQAGRAKNFWVLGLLAWLFGRELAGTRDWLATRFADQPQARDANLAALAAGHAHGETLELAAFPGLASVHERRKEGQEAPGSATKRRIISGTQAMALGLRTVAALAGRRIVYCSYPITPASGLLHALARARDPGITTFQAEDEIAAACAAIGASYAGAIGVTASAGPGLSLKTEALGLAVAAELPLVVIDVQRAGPSTGLPTKPEQADLDLAIHGRHGEAPLPVLAPATPADCFSVMIEAAETAIAAMTPVIVLADAYLANAACDWTPPDIDALPDLYNLGRTGEAPETDGEAAFAPFARQADTLARPWAAPGTPGLQHRIGGLEKQAGSGHISYDADNHAEMVRLRAEKVARVAARRPAATVAGAQAGRLLVVGWGSTHGAIAEAVAGPQAEGHAVGHLHLRQLWPLPRGLADVLARFERIVCPELNSGQLARLLRGEYLLPVEPLTQVTGQPFRVADLKAALHARLGDAS